MMKKNNKNSSFFRAYKIYTGDGFFRDVLVLVSWVLGMAFLVFMIPLIAIIKNVVEEGSFDGRSAVEFSAGASMGVFLVAVGFLNMGLCVNFERKMPGGKFFRTVIGGFTTYKTARYAFVLQTIIAEIFAELIWCLIYGYLNIMEDPKKAFLAVFLYSLFAVGISSFAMMIERMDIKFIVVSMLTMVIAIICFIHVEFLGFRVSPLCIAFFLLDLAVIYAGNSIGLSFYRKHRWND